MNSSGTSQRNLAQLVVFEVAGQACAIELDRVVRVLRMVRLMPLPKAPAIVIGIFDHHGEVLPVVSVRRRLRLPDRNLSPNDQLLVVQTRRRALALAVDRVDRVVGIEPDEITPPQALAAGIEGLQGVARLPERGLILVQDLDAFLSLDEDAQIATALAEGKP